ncbi:hypothetical protein F5X97DRAFT_253159 [Nemania serpens]|nr:hypothetical protein F5X97DRAFT_253159 [Nemania serpens]
MAGSVSPKPSFYLCPDFNIAPPPDGHLQLGSILRALDISGVLSPLDTGATVAVPESELFPRDKPMEKSGFTRSLKELRGLEGSIWAKLFGWDGLGAVFSFLRERENNETLQVEKLLSRYFVPTPEYMRQAIEVDGVSFYLKNVKYQKPVYLVTGLMWVEGAKLSKNQSVVNKVDAQAAATDPHSGTTGGARVASGIGDDLSTSFDGSTPFVLGIRVRKIWLDKHGVRHDATDVVGATLSGSKEKMDAPNNLKWIDEDNLDAMAGQIIADEARLGEANPVTWVWP